MMKQKQHAGERGQALIVFALVVSVLVGALALVVDVGQLYMTQRSIQNIADMAALAGAQQRAPGVQCVLTGAAVSDAYNYAGINGAPTGAGANGGWSPSNADGVMVSLPPSSGNYGGNPAYLEVRVARTVPALFAGIFNAGSVRLEGRAVAHGCGGFAEAAIVALDTGNHAIKSAGNSNLFVQGSIYSAGGIAVNSGNLTLSGTAYAKGSISGGNMSAGAGTQSGPSVPVISDPKWETPPVGSTAPGTAWKSKQQPTYVTVNGVKWKLIMPGTYRSITVDNGDHVLFQKGVYRVTKNDFKIQGVAAGFGDPHTFANQNVPDFGEPVSFVLDDGVTFDVTSSGTARFRSGPEYNNLIIRSFQDGNAVKIVGQGDVSLLGTIYAPNGDVEISGSAGGTVHGQIVAGSVSFTGGSGTAVVYDPNYIPNTKFSWLVE